MELNTLIQAIAQLQLARSTIASNNGDHKVIASLAMADAFAQDTAKQVVKRIMLTEPSCTHKDIERWHREGKLNESYRDLAIRLAVEPDLPGDRTIGFDATKTKKPD